MPRVSVAGGRECVAGPAEIGDGAIESAYVLGRNLLHDRVIRCADIAPRLTEGQDLTLDMTADLFRRGEAQDVGRIDAADERQVLPEAPFDLCRVLAGQVCLDGLPCIEADLDQVRKDLEDNAA